MSKQEFLELLDKYLEGSVSLQEEELIHNFYSSFQNEKSLSEAEVSKFNQLEEKLLNNILGKIES